MRPRLSFIVSLVDRTRLATLVGDCKFAVVTIRADSCRLRKRHRFAILQKAGTVLKSNETSSL